MTITQKRKALERAYPGIKWRLKVAAMPDAQVHSVYTRLLAEKKL